MSFAHHFRRDKWNRPIALAATHIGNTRFTFPFVNFSGVVVQNYGSSSIGGVILYKTPSQISCSIVPRSSWRNCWFFICCQETLVAQVMVSIIPMNAHWAQCPRLGMASDQYFMRGGERKFHGKSLHTCALSKNEESSSGTSIRRLFETISTVIRATFSPFLRAASLTHM